MIQQDQGGSTGLTWRAAVRARVATAGNLIINLESELRSKVHVRSSDLSIRSNQLVT